METPTVQALSPEQLQVAVMDFRQRVVAGEELTKEELAQALAAIRQQRRMLAETTTKRKPAQPPRSAAELLNLFKPQ